jgi:hypothetical protein
MPLVELEDAEIDFPDGMDGREVQGILDSIVGDFQEDLRRTGIKTSEYLGRLADNSVIVSTIQGMRPEDRTALLTSMIPGVGDVAGTYADYTDIKENFSEAPWHTKAAMVGGTLLGIAPFIPSRSQAKAAADVIRAYHGSPHDFPPVRELEMPDGALVYQSMDDAVPDGARVIKEHPLGRFNMSKIGTGEGAQFYGHGLYFADSEDVARRYRDELSRNVDYDGKPILRGNKQVGSTGDPDLDDSLIAELGDVDKAIDFWAKDLDSDSDALREFAKENIEKLELARSKVLTSGKGSMYQVEIDATPDEFLDWDLPLSEQPQMRKKLNEIAAAPYEESSLYRQLSAKGFDPEKYRTAYDDRVGMLKDSLQGFELGSTTGGTANRLLNEITGSHSGDATQLLSERGIKGIKYKDGFSRGAEGGTSNYVIFDDRLISISKKYGVAIPVAAAMLTDFTGEDTQGSYKPDM